MFIRKRKNPAKLLVSGLCLGLIAGFMLISLPGPGASAAAGQTSAWVGDWETIGSVDKGYFLYWAAGIAVDTSASSMKGSVYVAEPGEHRVRVRAAGGTTWANLPNSPFTASDQPWDVAVDKTGCLYVLNAIAAINGRAVWMYSPYTEQWTDLTYGYHFYAPEGIAVDNSGNVYVANTSSPTPLKSTVVKLAKGSTTWTVIGDATSGEPFITEPTGIAADGAGNVYVTFHDINTGYLAKLPAGSASWQLLRSHYHVRCGGVAADRFGNVYWAAGNTLQMIESSGTDRVVIALKPGSFNMPIGVAVDINGRVYVTDRTAGGNGLILTHQGWAMGLAWSTQPGNGETDRSLAQQPVVRLVDAAGQTMTGVSGVTVGLTLNQPGGAVLGYATAALVNGVAAFTNLYVDLPGTYTLKAACEIVSNPIYLYVDGSVYVDPAAVITSGNSAQFSVTQPPAAAPAASPAAGATVANGRQITLTSATPGATIHYTTDGSAPGAGSASGDAGGTQVTVNGPLGGTFTIKAYTSAAGLADSPVSTFSYNIYSADSYEVTFMDGSALYTSRTVAAGTAVGSAAWPVPSKPGYTFGGWFTGGGAEFKADTIVGANITVYARFDLINYTLTYYLNGGAVTAGNPAGYTVESAAITLNPPAREHYNFTGWSGTDIAGDPVLSVTIPCGSTGNRVYSANWTPISYSISYNLGGGSVSPANPASYTVETPYFTLRNPSRPGYTFAGWSGTDIQEGARYFNVGIDQGSSGNRSYTAHWTPISYSISYDLGGGSVSPANPASYTPDSVAITLNAPVREHYQFTGWSGTDIAGDPMLIVTIPQGSLGDRFYTAHWAPVSYSIGYNLAGGSVSPANPASYTVETPGFTLQNPTRAHYDFTGWTGTGLAAKTMMVTIPAGSAGDRQYAATWMPVSYSICYDLNGGMAANPEDYTVESETITLDPPVKEHYHFAGWSGTDIAGDPVLSVTIPQGSAGDREYTAHWSPVSYSIGYDLDGGTAANPADYTIESDPITLQNPVRAGYIFTGWTGTGLADKTMTVIIPVGSAGDRTYTANWEPVVFSGMPDTYTMNKGESVTWDARPEGGKWNWDQDYFSASFNSPATFRAHRVGASTITYTVNGVTHSINVTIADTSLPPTGPGGVWVWVLSVAATILLAAGIWLGLKKTQRR